MKSENATLHLRVDQKLKFCGRSVVRYRTNQRHLKAKAVAPIAQTMADSTRMIFFDTFAAYMGEQLND
jgi:hypothetical protein